MKKIFLVILFVNFSLWAQAPEKYHRAKIIYKTVENLRKLEQAGIPMDHGIHKAGYSLTSEFSDSEIQAARSLGLQVEIEIEDLKQFHSIQNSTKKTAALHPETTSCSTSAINYITPSNFQPGSMGGYYTYAEMLTQLDNMRASHPDLISGKSDVGSFLTSEGRALQWVKITKNPESINARPQVLYTAIHHAREPISLSETIFYMWYLLENYQTNDEVKYIVDNTELYFIPVVNPDGYIYNQSTDPDGGGFWRKNRHSFTDGNFGVDNNRNYDYWINGDASQSVWNTTGVSPDATGETYPGTEAFSEPETQAVKYFVENHNFRVALNAHTYSNLLLYPYGYDLNSPTPDDAYYNKISSIMASNGDLTNEISSLLYAASGDSDDFMYGQTMDHAKIFAFTPEIGESFWPAATEIIPLSNKMMFTNITAARLVNSYALLIDDTPDYLGNTAIVNANFSLGRYGLNGNGNFTISIHPVSANIASVGAPFQANGMAISDVLNGSIELQIAAGTASNDQIIFEYWIDNGQFIDKKLVTKKFGLVQPAFTDNGSAVSPVWTSAGWGTTTATFVSPPRSITDSPTGTYSNNQTKSITLTNPINLTGIGGGTITFAAKWNLEANYDFVSLQISTDNGVNWQNQCGKYTKTISSTGLPAYTGTQPDWINETVDLSDYAGQTIKIRFVLSSDEAVNYDGFYFDDFKVNFLQNTVLAVSNESVSAFRSYPNPVHSMLNINSPQQQNYSIKIFNLLGQLVVSKISNTSVESIDISALESGMYLIELQSGELIQTQKFLKD